MSKDKHEMDKIIPSGGEVLIYKTDNGKAKVDVRLVNETLWCNTTQSDIAQLFQCSADNISLHLKNAANARVSRQIATRIATWRLFGELYLRVLNNTAIQRMKRLTDNKIIKKLK